MAGRIKQLSVDDGYIVELPNDKYYTELVLIAFYDNTVNEFPENDITADVFL